MLKAALVCLVLAIIAYFTGLTGGLSMEIGRVLLVAFLVCAVIGVAGGLIIRDRPDDVL